MEEEKRCNPIEFKTVKLIKCHACDSEYHLIQGCPVKTKREESVNVVTEKSPLETLFDITLVTIVQMGDEGGSGEDAMSTLKKECIGSAALDSACISNVCRKRLLKHYVSN